MDGLKWFDVFSITRHLQSIKDDELQGQLEWYIFKEKLFLKYDKLLNYSIWLVILMFSILLHMFFLWGFDAVYSLKLKVNFSKEVLYFVEFSFLTLLICSCFWLFMYFCKKKVVLLESASIKSWVVFWKCKSSSEYSNWIELLIEFKNCLEEGGLVFSLDDEELIRITRQNLDAKINSSGLVNEYKKILFVKKEKSLLDDEISCKGREGKTIRL